MHVNNEVGGVGDVFSSASVILGLSIDSITQTEVHDFIIHVIIMHIPL
jgi:hypothetical protein